MKFLELANSLKDIKTAYIIKGDDDFLKSKALNLLKEACIKQFEDFNYFRVDFSTKNMSDLNELLTTLPIGDDTRLLIIDNFLLNNENANCINKIVDLGSQNSRLCVVFYEPKISGNTGIEVIDCSKLDTNTFERWVLSFLKKNDLRIDKMALEYISFVSDCDLTFCNSELPKVVAYCDETKHITINDVKLLLTKNENYFIYNLTNSIDEKNNEKYNAILNTLTQTEMVGNVFTFMGSYFKKMFYCAVSNENDEEIALYLNIKPYAIKKSKENIKKNGKLFYINLFQKYVENDTNIKSGKISPLNALYSLAM